MVQAIPLSLYVHLPWCVQKCPYCDFNSHARKGTMDEAAYHKALIADLENELPEIWGRPVISIFFGGGTPSLFSPNFYERLLSALRARLLLAPDLEVTLEANPGTIERGSFLGYRQAGINRISLGAQSFHAEQLKRLGRIHGPQAITESVAEIKAAGFTRFNLDVMHGLPKQTLEEAMRDLQIALTLEAPHLSWYQLTIEPNTVFAARPPALPSDDTLADIEEAGFALLAKAGYDRYEVSAFAKGSEQYCRHNINYWQFGDYLGIGAGAHGKITNMATGCVKRRWKIRQPQSYLAAAEKRYLAGEKLLSAHELRFEFMLNAFRLMKGFSAQQYERYTGLAWAELLPILQAASDLVELDRREQWVKPSALGVRYLNNLVAKFL